MKINSVSSGFRGNLPINKNSINKVKQPVQIWAENRNLCPDYSNHLRVFLNNTIYNRNKGIGRHSVEGYAAVAKLFDTKKIVALNGESAVFLLNDGNILKLSVDKYNEYLPQFHAPELCRGSIITPKKYDIFSYLTKEQTDTFYYVVQEKGECPITKESELELVDKVKAAGYDLCDIKHDQFAYFNINGKKEARFIDLGCIVPKGQGGW